MESSDQETLDDLCYYEDEALKSLGAFVQVCHQTLGQVVTKKKRLEERINIAAKRSIDAKNVLLKAKGKVKLMIMRSTPIGLGELLEEVEASVRDAKRNQQLRKGYRGPARVLHRRTMRSGELRGPSSV